MKKHFLLLPLLALTLERSTKPKQYDEDSDLVTSIAKGTVIASAIGACGYALYKVGEWLFCKSDKQMFDEAKRSYKQTKEQYSDLILRWSHEIAFHSDEACIEYLLPAIKKISPTNSLFYYFGETMRTLKNHHEQLKKRIAHSSDQLFIDRASHLAKQLRSLRQSLKPLYKYISERSGFFNLYEIYKKLQNDYKKEWSHWSCSCNINTRPDTANHLMNVIGDYYAVQASFQQAVATCVLAHNNHNYPYITYVDTLKKDIATLKTAMKEYVTNYQILYGKSGQLDDMLQYILSTIVLHDAYHQEQLAYQQHKLEQEHIALEKKRVAIEQAKANAQQQQAWALQEQNRLRREEIRNQEKILRKLDDRTCHL